MNNDNPEMTVTDIINTYLTKIGLLRTKEFMLHGVDDKYRKRMESTIDKAFNRRIIPTSWGIRALPSGDFEVVYL